MATDAHAQQSVDARTIPVYRALRRLARDPMGTFAHIGRESHGDVVKLNGVLFRPYLLTRPEHVQHVLVDHADNYLRTGMLWTQLQRLEGNGLAGEGERWRASRQLFQPIFSARNIRSLIERMGAAIVNAVDELGDRGASAEPLDASVEMARIVHRALLTAFFGDRISIPDAERLGTAITAAVDSLGPRLMLPFLPQAVPLPGDRTFRKALRTADDIMYPLVRQARCRRGGGQDLVSFITNARTPDGRALTDRQVRDDLVAVFVAGTETTALALTWLWAILGSEPKVAATLHAEVDRLVWADRPYEAHLPHLAYTKMVLQEVLRLYPASWMIPRTVQRDDVIDGVRIAAGATVLLTPYVTQRSEQLWDRPLAFDPYRFSPREIGRRHPFAYFPFGAGPHRCLGSYLFTVEAQLIVAALLRRFRVELVSREPFQPHAGATIRPDRPVEFILRPAARFVRRGANRSAAPTETAFQH